MYKNFLIFFMLIGCSPPESPTESMSDAPLFQVRPAAAYVDAKAKETELQARRSLLVESVLAEIPEQHRAAWRDALSPDGSTTIYSVEGSKGLAASIAEIYAIDIALARRSNRLTQDDLPSDP